MLCGFLLGAVGATHLREVSVERLLPRYLEAPQLLERTNDAATAGESDGRKTGLCFRHFGNALFLHSKKQDDLLFIEAAAVQTRNNTKEGTKFRAVQSS